MPVERAMGIEDVMINLEDKMSVRDVLRLFPAQSVVGDGSIG
jgi:hypothetical protein